MIARLQGLLIDKGIDSVVVDCHGVGYEVRVSLRALESLPPLEERVTLFVHTLVREDELTLYGFLTAGERRLFQRVISVTGIGPKLALSGLSVMSAQELQRAVLADDLTALCRIPGVGRKTAQRMVLELQGKLAGIALGDGAPASGTTSAGELDDLRTALTELGFVARQIDPVVAQLRSQAEEGARVEVLIRQALRLLRAG